ncbi:Uncharacterised protein [Leclercia adecarboxylata]|uniref:Uncharacterized protein n=1 Tax=Leclercia adecarboxylata TaxID=83655 RepID=A0A4V6JKG7_9ENTR|nr:Uncharacterised protein [Leclercia adecarboxylata]
MGILYSHAASKETKAKNARPKPVQVIREVALKRRRAMLFSNSAITSTPATSLIAAMTSAQQQTACGEVRHLPPGDKHPDEHLQHHQLFQADAPLEQRKTRAAVFRQRAFL